MKDTTISFQNIIFKTLNQWAKILNLQTPKGATHIYLESILQSSLNNIYWINKEGTIIGCNDQQAKYMGLNNRRDLIGKNVMDIGCRNNDLKVMQTGKTYQIEENCFTNGETRYFLSSKSPMFDHSGEIIGVLGISTDITEQKRITQELELEKTKAETANRVKSEFIANISHDIRTPLSGIFGIANLLKEKAPQELQNDISAIATASNELLTLLNGVIDICKIESDNPHNQPLKEFNLRDIIFRLMELLTPLVNYKNLSMSITYPEGIPNNFKGMPFLIQRILLNVVSNAIKFTDQGHIKIHVSRYQCSAFDINVFPLLLMVEDTGIGISASDCEKIFENFFRVNPSFQGQFSGCGLGLSIAKKFIEKMGGRIWVKSEPYKGSQFFILLPLHLCDDGISSISSFIDNEILEHIDFLQTKTPNLSEHIKPNQSDRRILVVEDNVLIQRAVAALLTKLNNNVDVAANGKKALMLAQQAMYDLIFMDIGLPDMDGFTVSKQIREFNSEIPIIALTAHLDQKYRHICQEAGINDIITKPLTLELAQDCLEQYTCKSPSIC